MSNFSKAQKVEFDKVVEGFNDAFVLSKTIAKFNTDSQELERANNTIYRPVPYIGRVSTSVDQTGLFRDATQLTVPAQLNLRAITSYKFTSLEMNDPNQETNIGKAAMQILASKVNQDVNTVATLQGANFIKRTVAATGFDDVSQIEVVLNESGVPMNDRNLALSSGNYNNIAKDLAGRQTLTAGGKAQTAYDRAYVGNVASFDTYKLDYAPNILARSATGVTVNGANQRWVPAATVTAANGIGVTNVDNRYQNLNVTVTSGTIRVGDAISFPATNWVHRITKVDTGIASTHRVTAIISGGGGTGTIQISPPIIAADSSPTDAELFYQNVTATPANGATITFLNTVTGKANPFWVKEAIELLPGKFNVDAIKRTNTEVMVDTTESGIMVRATKQYVQATDTVTLRYDAFYGVNMTLPEHAGVVMFNQT